ncbi:hypothetical protein GTQ34_05690 [Muricauda sp. JGD-17]|uniref:Uncharacterized protein n=1 Tax=Flagellimonas ochracea TaxID=2696472 RepID=A0A964WWT2_9FLAO|nr:hypothetical protein [Allomuricauda ochracea]NAY91406.1 hypothetical protein [Allomuricauda ochracea]
MNPINLGLIDHRNENLWNDLNKTHIISISVANYPNYGVYSKGQDSLVQIPENDIDIDSFTHELLHILLRQNEIFFGSRLGNFVSENPILDAFFSDNLIEHFGNCIEHIKMLPIYLDLGFDKKKFIEDYEENKCTKSEIKWLNANFKIRNVYQVAAIDFYIAKYISIQADAKRHVNYPKSLEGLKKIDFRLFDILKSCVENWKELPLTKTNPWDEDYGSIALKFTDSLVQWADGKTIV